MSEDLKEIVDYIAFKGMNSNREIKEIIIALDEYARDYDLTFDIIKTFIKVLFDELEGYPEDKEHLKRELISMVKRVYNEQD